MPHLRTAPIPILLFLFLSLPSFCGAAIESLPEEHPVYRQALAIYERLAPAFGDERMTPRLLVIPRGTKVREPVASSAGGNEGALTFESSAGLLTEGYVAIEERTIEVLSELGKDRDNALAFLLAHELAHIYLRHGWVGDFGNAFARTDMGRKMMKAATYDDLVRRETEADHFGGFYGYLAGYDTLGVAPRALEKIYASFGLPDQLPNYPSKAERIAIARRQGENIAKLLPVHEAAVRLLVLGRYVEAGRLFIHLAQIFPSREMFNNAGVAFALEAVRLLPPNQLPFIHPFELDTESRLMNREPSGQRIARSGGGDDLSIRRNRLLRRALNAFEQAVRRDKGYAPARINAAAAQSLLGDQDEAIRLAGSALSMARDQGERVSAGHALVVRAIALARSGDRQRAKDDLEAARQVVPDLAAMNLAVLDGTKPAFFQVEENGIPGPPETIAGHGAREAFSRDRDGTGFHLSPAEKGEDSLSIHSRREHVVNAAVINLGERRIGILATLRDYPGASARGIRIGSPLASLGRQYGNADRIVPTRQGAWYLYNTPGIAFEIDSAGRVAAWFVFVLR